MSLLSELPMIYWVLAACVGSILISIPILSGVRYIPNNTVGIVEKLWSPQGSLEQGRIIALEGEAGFQADVLRGGVHFCYWRWQYSIRRVPLVVVPQGKIAYVYSRDGQALAPTQTLGHVVECNNFQDARAFLCGESEDCIGQRGRQRAILREGVYAINLALFVVIADDSVYQLGASDRILRKRLESWQEELSECDGFRPVIIGKRQSEEEECASHGVDTMGIVTVHDGPSLGPGQIIAPAVGTDPEEPNYHGHYQDPEAFLRAGGRRGRQYIPLTDGTYFINRWFATVEIIPKTIVPIGNVGVVVSYYGKVGQDVSGTDFRHGERVGEEDRGVRQLTLSPGKYAFNKYAGHVHLVPTTNFVLHWITGRSENHRYDESLKSIDLVTADAYEPLLPLSVVVHIDYQKAPSVVQRFGDVKTLITQTLDPLLSAYFRDIAHKKTMLELLHDRDAIQRESKAELRQRFAQFDIELVDVLIGKPDTAEVGGGEIETLLEQLRLRQLSRERIETYDHQRAAAEELKALKMAEAHANKQTELTNSEVQIRIAANEGESELARARKLSEQKIVTAQADAKAKVLIGEAESKHIFHVGKAEADVLSQKVQSYGNPNLYALSVVTRQLAESKQPLVPDQLFVAAGNGDGHSATNAQGLLGTLLSLLVAEKSGMNFVASRGAKDVSEELEEAD